MIYTAIILTVFLVILLIINFKNKYALYFCVMIISLDILIIASVLLISRRLNYGYPSGTLFLLDYKIYLYISSFKTGFYTIIRLMNYSVALFIFSQVLYIYEFTRNKWEKLTIRKNLKFMMLLVFPVLYILFYSPEAGYAFYLTLTRASLPAANQFVKVLKTADTMCYLVMMFYLAYPLIMLYRALRHTNIFIRKKQLVSLIISIAILNALFICIFGFGSLKKPYILSFNLNESLLKHPRITNTQIFYSVVMSFMILLSVGTMLFVIIRNKVVGTTQFFKQIIINKNFSELNKNMRGIFHSFKNNFLSIRLLVEQLENEDLSPEGAYAVTRLRTISSVSIDNVTRALNSFKEIKINRGNCNIIDCIEAAIKKVSIECDIKIERDYRVDELYSYIDFYHMTEVFCNLIQNAIEAMSKKSTGEKNITIYVDQENEWNLVNITDNGPGIEEKDLRRVFKPFFSAKPSNMGIGLSYVRKVVKMHLGSIDVQSFVGQYTTFQVLLPSARRKSRI